ncbi:MAG: LysR family transcriptional regulator [Pseudomonadales bacterium]
MERLVSQLPPFKALVAFEAVLRLGTVTAAARELTSTQPAISQHLKTLEQNLECRLFTRSGRFLKPTAKALSYFNKVQPLLRELAGATEEARISNQRENLVNIVCNSGLAHFWLLPLLPMMQAELPELTINITLSDSDTNTANALQLSFGKLAQRSTQQTLFTEQVCAICSPRYAEQHQLGPSTNAVQVAALDLIHMDQFDERWLNWRDWLRLQGEVYTAEPNSVMLGNYHTVISTLKADQGVALGWLCLIQPELSAGNFVQVGRSVVTRVEHGYFVDTKNAAGENDRKVADYLLTRARRSEP